MIGYRYETASDVIRDGLGIELINERGTIAEVFRNDEFNTLTLTCYEQDIPFVYIEKLISMARKTLQTFENGTPFPEKLA